MRTAFLSPLSVFHLHQHRFLHVRTKPRVPAYPKMSISEHIKHLRSVQPPLESSAHKGQSGRIAIIGGSELYTGAPYFASQSALLAGADLSYVYTTPSAAPAIKTYSPDLIVHPGFDHLGPNLEALGRIHAVVIGPGLGRHDYTKELVKDVLRWNGIIVLDADALWFLQDEDVRNVLSEGNAGVRVLTPNKIEAIRLLRSSKCDTMESFTEKYPNVVILEKGQVDRIVYDGDVVEVSTQAAKKRVGGQGDVLAGVLAAFCGWCKTKEQVLSACVGASMVARTSGRLAFAEVGRALLASDLLRFVGSAVEEVLGIDNG